MTNLNLEIIAFTMTEGTTKLSILGSCNGDTLNCRCYGSSAVRLYGALSNGQRTVKCRLKKSSPSVYDMEL